VEYAEVTNTVVLAPLFPGGVANPNDMVNYAMVERDGMRFDLILLDMLDEISERFNVDVRTFALCGFSGGAQFAHRFAYLHGERLWALSIGAPGGYTLLDDEVAWPKGTANCVELFGVGATLEPLRGVPVQMYVGELDTEVREFRDRSLEEHRLLRARTLVNHWIKHGVTTQLEIVPGVAHDSGATSYVVEQFLTNIFQSGASRPHCE
jgi:hypothetical protein